jgi:diguanylate cyclase (GGDEF)-like protein
VGLVVTDLNGLKLVNDAYGNREGDKLLCEATTLLERLGGPGARVYRIGGDEFAILLHDAEPALLQQLVEGITAACRDTLDRSVPISISLGAELHRDDEEDIHEVYHRAEDSMHANKLLESRSMRSHILESLRGALRARNLETADHTRRMEHMVTAVGHRLGLSGAEYDRLALLASMHDIGKVAIPDSIINKPGKLTDAEWEVMRSHSEIGARIASTAQELAVIYDEIACHHERWDGSGYPSGRTGDEIPLLARIIAVVDSYDVMTHRRVYKAAVSHEEALRELARCAGSQFDPHIVELFLDIFGAMTPAEMTSFSAGG